MKAIIFVRSKTFSYFSRDKIRHIQLITSTKAELRAENQSACFSWKAVFGGFLGVKMENKAEQQMFMVTLVYFSVLLRCTFKRLRIPDFSPGRSNPEHKIQLWKFKHSSVIQWLCCRSGCPHLCTPWQTHVRNIHFMCTDSDPLKLQEATNFSRNVIKRNKSGKKERKSL